MSASSEFDVASVDYTDHEHEVQLGLLRALCGAARENRDPATVGGILEQLVAYSEVHFTSEELLMRLKSYDGYEDHVDDHIQMLDMLSQLAADHAAGKSSLIAAQAEEILGFIGNHIATRDKRFADFARNAH